MAQIDQKIIDRINELYKKKQAGTLTEQETLERKDLQKEYVKQFRDGFKTRMDNLDITFTDIDENGKEVELTMSAKEYAEYKRKKDSK